MHTDTTGFAAVAQVAELLCHMALTSKLVERRPWVQWHPQTWLCDSMDINSCCVCSYAEASCATCCPAAAIIVLLLLLQWMQLQLQSTSTCKQCNSTCACW